MTRSSAGRQLYAMGGNPEAARRLGINIAAMHFLAYGYLGLMAGLAGLLQAHRVGEAVPNAMYGNELNVLAAAVLGGASLTGGIGTVGGVLLGILLLAMLQNGLNLLGRLALLLPDRDRPGHPGLDLDHRPVQPRPAPPRPPRPSGRADDAAAGPTACSAARWRLPGNSGGLLALLVALVAVLRAPAAGPLPDLRHRCSR